MTEDIWGYLRILGICYLRISEDSVHWGYQSLENEHDWLWISKNGPIDAFRAHWFTDPRVSVVNDRRRFFWSEGEKKKPRYRHTVGWPQPKPPSEPSVPDIVTQTVSQRNFNELRVSKYSKNVPPPRDLLRFGVWVSSSLKHAIDIGLDMVWSLGGLPKELMLTYDE